MKPKTFWFKFAFLNGLHNEVYSLHETHQNYAPAFFWGRVFSFLFSPSEEDITNLMISKPQTEESIE